MEKISSVEELQSRIYNLVNRQKDVNYSTFLKQHELYNPYDVEEAFHWLTNNGYTTMITAHSLDGKEYIITTTGKPNDNLLKEEETVTSHVKPIKHWTDTSLAKTVFWILAAIAAIAAVIALV